MFKSDPYIAEWQYTTKKVKELELKIILQQRKHYEAQNASENAKRTLEEKTKEVTNAVMNLTIAKKHVDTLRLETDCIWADSHFFINICENQESQSSCPWVTKKYNILREELFYQALMLHKVLILSSNKVKTNLTHLFNVWDGKITNPSKSEIYAHLLNTLMLIIPVISTTFASVQTFLDGIGPEELGTLIVDESGQATPQSVLGALLRTRKAIIVGDPLQVEPIVTTPKKLSKIFADEYNIPSAYRDFSLSVQTLADSINKYGGYRTINDSPIWLGCPLTVHRRCLDPMFTISNEVAYNNRMFLETQPPNPEPTFLFKRSVWLDCRGKEIGNKNHVVNEQIQLAINLIEKAIVEQENLPDIFLITPFTTIAKELIKKICKIESPLFSKEDIKEWAKGHCGTVHTFQGKEANEVIFILGCDSNSGLYAANWVGQKPNIVNVAVSRAKYRLAVIGDYSLWNNIPYVQNICRYLNPITDFLTVTNNKKGL